jgi:hypothetical protein
MVGCCGWFGCWAGEIDGPATGFRKGWPKKRSKTLGKRFGLKAKVKIKPHTNKIQIKLGKSNSHILP